jgi:hypothetical protein
MFRALPLRPRGEPLGALVLVQDVTEVRRRDRALLSKDATIREIHHRVKNNLQTVASLLRLQARATDTDPRKGQLAVAWLKAHAKEYAGQHVALDGDHLVGSGRTIRDAQAAAKSNGYPQALLVHVPPREGGTWGG